MSSEQYEASDRYGGHYPDPATVCPGPCEGVGYFPAYSAAHDIGIDPAVRVERLGGDDTGLIAARGVTPGPDGYAFVICDVCFGTGKSREAMTLADLEKLWQRRRPDEVERAIDTCVEGIRQRALSEEEAVLGLADEREGGPHARALRAKTTMLASLGVELADLVRPRSATLR